MNSPPYVLLKRYGDVLCEKRCSDPSSGFSYRHKNHDEHEEIKKPQEQAASSQIVNSEWKVTSQYQAAYDKSSGYSGGWRSDVP
jgi:hypothetical protein